MAEQAEAEQNRFATSDLITSDLSAFADVEMLAEFVTESREHLASVEEKLLLIEKDSSDMESINAVFRGVHTVKGLAGFLELKSIQDIAHEVETLFDHARSGRLVITPPLVDALFEGIDYLSEEVERVQRHLTGGEHEADVSNSTMLLHLRAVTTGAMESHTVAIAGPSDGRAQTASTQKEKLDVPAAGDLPTQAGDLSVRIGASRLDRLMDLVGELVIAHTLVRHNQHVTIIEDPRLISDLALLGRITDEVQRVTTSMRMVQIGIQFQKTARVVRDLSRQLGKQIVMAVSGEEIELDKTIAEALSNPLLHMVRNSIDHGIELPEERLLTGKDPVAQIRLAAYHQSAQIVIEIADDGRGLDRDRILAKAVERGVVKAGTQLPDKDIYQLIFEPGFSTAQKVTGISGRGVGMDVVRRHVQKLRGRIDIRSEAGVGTTFFLRLPLTLAILEGLVVEVGDSRYVLPVYSVSEIFCPNETQLSRDEELEAVMLRGISLPVIRLHRSFHLEPRAQSLVDGVLIVIESQGRRCCLFVDAMLGKQELVIKGLGELLKDATGLMGCAVLSDGRVGLILDVDSIMP